MSNTLTLKNGSVYLALHENGESAITAANSGKDVPGNFRLLAAIIFMATDARYQDRFNQILRDVYAENDSDIERQWQEFYDKR